MSERIERAVAAVAPDVLGAVAFAVSYRHVQHVLATNGATGWTSWALATALEALAITSVLELRRRRRLHQSVVPPVGVLLCGIALVVACNLESARTHGWATVVALLGPVLYLLAWTLVATRGTAGPDPRVERDAALADLVAARESIEGLAARVASEGTAATRFAGELDQALAELAGAQAAQAELAAEVAAVRAAQEAAIEEAAAAERDAMAVAVEMACETRDRALAERDAVRVQVEESSGLAAAARAAAQAAEREATTARQEAARATADLTEVRSERDAAVGETRAARAERDRAEQTVRESAAELAAAEAERIRLGSALEAASRDLSQARTDLEAAASREASRAAEQTGTGKGAGRINPLAGWTGDASPDELAVLAAVLESVQLRRGGKRLTYSAAQSALGVRYEPAKAALVAARDAVREGRVILPAPFPGEDIADAEILPMPSPRVLEPAAAGGTR